MFVNMMKLVAIVSYNSLSRVVVCYMQPLQMFSFVYVTLQRVFLILLSI